MAVYLQKASTAKRVYATLVHSKTNSDGNKDQGRNHRQFWLNVGVHIVLHTGHRETIYHG